MPTPRSSMLLRLPSDLKRRLREQARAHKRSMTKEIEYLVESSVAKQHTARASQ
jgi:plasmid stability protein